METLTIRIRGEVYQVDEHGCIMGGPNDVKPTCINGHQWDFIGVSTHHWHNRPTISFKQIWENPSLALNGYMWDIDHGTVRVWGGSYNGKLPKITLAYKA